MKKLNFLLLTLAIHVMVFAQEDRSKMDWPNLARYAKENEMLGLPGKAEKRVVFMGNSITEGWKNTDSAFFINNGYIDRGISAQTTSQMLLRFRSDVINLKPSVVVILAGINDIAENTGPISLENILGNIVSMAELARANHIKPVICSVLPALDFYWHPGLQPAGKVIRLNAMLKNYCSKNRIVYVDYHSKMVDEQMGLDKKYTDDAVHPTLAGYKVMNVLVQEGITRALKN